MYNAIVSPGCTNTLFVFAAGNDGADNDVVPQYPCNYHLPGAYGPGAPNVVCVAATNDLDELADFSNHGAASVHLAAPGVDILSTWPAYQTIFAPDGFDDPDGVDLRRALERKDIDPRGLRSGAVPRSCKDSGTHSLTDSPSGNYADNSTTTIRLLPPLGLTLRVGCRVSYEMVLDTEPCRLVSHRRRADDGADDDCRWLVGFYRRCVHPACPPISLLIEGQRNHLAPPRAPKQRHCATPTVSTSTISPSPAWITPPTSSTQSAARRWPRLTWPGSPRSHWRRILR